ncbi:MAG: hypothetical protein J6B99_02470 [Oscillospiraceae bacterium]|nr:hypothetical protein [Oscillospiraceae bacterium]
MAEEAKKKGGCLGKIGIAFVVIIVLGMIGGMLGGEDEGTGASGTDPAQSVESSEKADKTMLEAASANAKEIDLSIYTEDSAAALTAALAAVDEVLADEDATQEQVDDAHAAMAAAIGALTVPFSPDNYEAVSYEDVARNPDDYNGVAVKFSGNVLQVIEGEGETDLRIATDGGYDDVILAAYEKGLIDFRILEDDQVNVYGTCLGLYTYTSTIGAEISVPLVLCDHIELQ